MATNELRNFFASRFQLWATDILNEQIFLGSGSNAADLDQLRAHGIKRVLNVADDVPNFHEREEFIYHRLNVVDFGQDEGISRVFPGAFEFLDTAFLQKEPVLVHCAAGANRSATIVLAWLMHSQQWTLRQVLHFT